MTKLFEKYSEMLKSDTLTESNLIALKSRLSGRQLSLTNEEVNELWEILDDCSYKITQDHAEKGIDYLRRKAFKNNGSRRHTKQLEFMDSRFFEAIKNYDHFTFVGFEELDAYFYQSFYMPIWRIHTTNGETFDYCMGVGLTFQEVGYNKITLPLQLVG